MGDELLLVFHQLSNIRNQKPSYRALAALSQIWYRVYMQGDVEKISTPSYISYMWESEKFKKETLQMIQNHNFFVHPEGWIELDKWLSTWTRLADVMMSWWTSLLMNVFEL